MGCFVFWFFLERFLWLVLVSSLYTHCIPIGVLFLVLIHLFINQYIYNVLTYFDDTEGVYLIRILITFMKLQSL